MIAGAGLALVLFARLWPVDLSSEATWRVVVDLAAFMARTFLLHLGLLLLLAVFLSIRQRMKRTTAVLIPTLLVCLWPTLRSFHADKGRAPDAGTAALGTPGKTTGSNMPSSGAIRILSVNLYAENRSPGALADEIAQTDADVILFQEYTPAWQTLLRPRMAAGYPHFSEAPQDDCFGAATFSRLPFVEPPRVDLPIGITGNPQVRTVVAFGGGPSADASQPMRVAIYNVHLLPPGSLEYVRVNRREFLDLLHILAEERLPAIVSGDFNFTGDSRHADMLREAGYADAFDQLGGGPQWTWPVLGPLRYVPGLRLDHMYLSRGLRALAAKCGVGAGSDHRPVLAEVSGLNQAATAP